MQQLSSGFGLGDAGQDTKLWPVLPPSSHRSAQTPPKIEFDGKALICCAEPSGAEKKCACFSSGNREKRGRGWGWGEEAVGGGGEGGRGGGGAGGGVGSGWGEGERREEGGGERGEGHRLGPAAAVQGAGGLVHVQAAGHHPGCGRQPLRRSALGGGGSGAEVHRAAGPRTAARPEADLPRPAALQHAPLPA